jgi:hypothetical protein
LDPWKARLENADQVVSGDQLAYVDPESVARNLIVALPSRSVGTPNLIGFKLVFVMAPSFSTKVGAASSMARTAPPVRGAVGC